MRNNITAINYRRAISLLLVLAMVISCCSVAEPAMVKAASNDFYISGDTLISYRGSDTKVTVPSGVKKIGYNAFYNKTNVKEVILPEGLTEIDGEAFSYCSSLTKVTLPSTLTTIGSYAFFGTGITQIKLPDSVTSLGSAVFYKCTSLKKVVIGKGITEIPDRTFGYTEKLTSVTLHSKVVKIGVEAFYGSGLKSFTCPAALTTIENYAFCDCSDLSKVSFNSKLRLVGRGAFGRTAWYNNLTADEDGYIITDGILFGGNHFFDRALVIPNGVKVIAGDALHYWHAETVELPKTLLAIGPEAFSYCINLKEITVPSSVKYIGDKAFTGCTDLEDISLPAKLTYKGVDILPEKEYTMDKLTVKHAGAIADLMAEGYPVNVNVPGASYETSREDSEAFIEELVQKIAQAKGLACVLDPSEWGAMVRSSVIDGVESISVSFSSDPYQKSAAASKKLLKNVETLKMTSVTDTSVNKLSGLLSKNKAVLLKIKSTSAKLDSKLNSINKKLKAINKAGVILRFDTENNYYLSGGKKYRCIPTTKGGYVSLVLSAETIKTYNGAVTFLNKVFETAKKNAYSDSNYGSSYSEAKKVLSNAKCMNDLSDAMKVYAVATSAFFRAVKKTNSFCMVYDMAYSYDVENYIKDSDKLKILNADKARGVCHDFAIYEMLLWSCLGIENYYNSSYELNHGWSVVKVKNSAGKVMWIPFDYDIGPNPMLSGFHYNPDNAEQVAARYKIYLNGVPGAPDSKNFTAGDFK